jgi:hypothetical protein
MPLFYDFDHFLDSRAEICQIFRWFFGKFKKSKRHSEINWPLKVRQIWNDFFKLTILPKNERTNSTLLLVNLFSFVFWMKVKTPKIHFEINWPLAKANWQRFFLFSSHLKKGYILQTLMNSHLIPNMPYIIRFFGDLPRGALTRGRPWATPWESDLKS